MKPASRIIRRSRRTSLRVAAVAAAFALAAFAVRPGVASAAADKPKTVLKIATLAPEGSTWMNLMHELDDRVREATGNEVGFKFYAGGIQGDERLVLRKMRTGQLQGGGFTGNGLGVVAPSLRVLESPFLFETTGEIDTVYAQLGNELEGALTEGGHHLLGWAEVGFVHLFTKKPVRSVEDLRATKMWLWEGDPLAKAFFDEAGVTPVSLAITDVYTSLQTGLIEGVYSSPYAAVVLQWHTQVHAMSEAPITNAIGAVIVTQASWDKVSPDSQKKIHDIAEDVFARLNTSSREDNEKAIVSIREAGIEIVPFPEAEMAVFREIGQRAARRGVGELYSQDLLTRVRGVVTAYRESHAAGK